MKGFRIKTKIIDGPYRYICTGMHNACHVYGQSGKKSPEDARTGP